MNSYAVNDYVWVIASYPDVWEIAKIIEISKPMLEDCPYSVKISLVSNNSVIYNTYSTFIQKASLNEVTLFLLES